MKRFISVLVVGMVSLSVMGAAHAEFWNPVDVSLRDISTDALRSDGNAIYSGNGDHSRIENRTTPDGGNVQDVFVFEPKGKRFYSIHTPAVEGGIKICDERENRISFFSRQLHDWFDVLTAMPVGTTVTSDAGMRCRSKKDSINYYFDFPSSELNHNDQPECGLISKLGESTFRFEMPSNCLAEVYRLDTRGRGTGGKIEGLAVSLPFQITAELETAR